MRDSPSQPCSICVIGSINMDFVVHTPRFVQPGETLTAHAWRTVPGGKGANQAVAAARLGAKTLFCGRIGNDAFGATLRAGLVGEAIDVENLGITGDCGTGVAMIAVEDSGRNAIYVVGGANHTLTRTHLEQFSDSIQRSNMLMLQLEIPIEATLAAIDLARLKGIPVLLDPAPSPQNDFPDELLRVDLLSPNETETEALTGIALGDLTRAKCAAIDLAKRGAKQVVIKLGERGAVAFEQDGDAWHISAAPVDVVDTTAAGDAFSAALAVAKVEGKDLISAAQFACAAGAVAVGRAGAQPSMPTRSELDALRGKHEFQARKL